jgi:hypothetical protein
MIQGRGWGGSTTKAAVRMLCEQTLLSAHFVRFCRHSAYTYVIRADSAVCCFADGVAHARADARAIKMTKRSSTLFPVLFVIALVLFAILYFNFRRQSAKHVFPSAASAYVGPAQLYPDATSTPGATDPRVSQSNIAETICVAGWTKTVRPPVRVTHAIKVELMRTEGVIDSSSYELDHLIPLELGGCPDCKENLWLEPYDPQPGARQKDRVENFLHREVCRGAMPLEDAQKAIASDWYKIYIQISGSGQE